MNLFRKTTITAERKTAITEEMRQEAVAAFRQGMQQDLLVLAERLRMEAPLGSPEFRAGVDWSVVWLENFARQLTEQEPSGPRGDLPPTP